MVVVSIGMKDKRYKRVKKAIIAGASTGIVAGLILMGYSNTALADTTDLSIPAYTQSTSDTGVHVMRKWNTPKGLNALAGMLGLDRDEIRNELKSGKTIKQIMQEYGVNPSDLNVG